MRRAFATAAVMLMVAVAFQVAVMPGAAFSNEPSATELSQPLEEYSTDVTEDAATPSPQRTQEDVQPLQNGLPGGSAESYGQPPVPTVSSMGTLVQAPEFVTDDDSISIRTVSGIYQINLSASESLALRTTEGELLVRGSYFSLRSPSFASALPVNQVLDCINDTAIVAHYGLVAEDSLRSPIATIEVTTDFSSLVAPKITAKVTEVSPWVVDWQVIWSVEPTEGAEILFPKIMGKSLPIERFDDTVIPVDLSVEVSVPGSEKDGQFSINWEDARDGTLTARSIERHGATVHLFEVAFGIGQEVIDPTLVSTSSGSYPTDLTCQRKVVLYDGYYWAFYDRGDTICYRRSADGSSWSSEYALPEGTALATGFGFDVSARDGKIGVGWIDSGKTNAYFKAGHFLGSKIEWNSRSTVTGLNTCYAPVSVAIGTDGAYCVFVQWNVISGIYRFSVYRSFDGLSWTSIGPTSDMAFSNTYTWNAILPFGCGNLVLLETSDQYTSVRVRYWISAFGVSDGWNAPMTYEMGLAPGTKGDKFSPVVASDGSVYIAMKNAYNYLGYAQISPGGVMSKLSLTTYSVTGYPTVSLDENDDLHIFWLDTNYIIKHIQKASGSYADWSTVDTFYTSAVSMKSLTSWVNPLGTHTLLWTKNTIPAEVMFGSIPMPYGTPGASAEPWNVDGLSKYSIYSSTFRDAISPGSGLLTLFETDVSVEGRGVDLSISRLYQQPRYFRTSNGAPYTSFAFPYCNLGPGWSLDLPWINEDYVYTGNGQRFVIQWGNAGDPSEFENHNGIEFVLRDVDKNTPQGSLEYYELIFSSGVRYTFGVSTFWLQSIADLRSYDPSAYSYTPPCNSITPQYDVNGRLSYLEDTNQRRISFSYNANGMLQTITRPDADTIQFAYTYLGSAYRLSSVTDVKGCVTSFSYLSSTYNYILSSIVFPTGAKNTYSYALDTSVGTEVRAWLVTQQKVTDASTGVLFRQTDYDYRIVSGDVKFVNVTKRDGGGVVQGTEEHIFASDLMYSSDTARDANGAQMSKSVTWYDEFGRLMRVDRYNGNSKNVSYSEWTEYDNWGNVIFTRNAMGYESYASYVNTETQNSYQGGSLFTKTTSGKIAYDSFDDWEFSGWIQYGDNLVIDGTADPPNAPALRMVRDAGNPVYYYFSPPEDFVFQIRTMVSSLGDSEAVTYSLLGEYTRALVRVYEGTNSFEYRTPTGQYYPFASWVANTWYDLGFVIHDSSDTYDIYLDGTLTAAGVSMLNSVSGGPISRFSLSMSTLTGFAWIDEIRIYRSPTVTLSMGNGYVAELYDADGEIIDRSKTGSLVASESGTLPLSFPQGYISIYKIGYSSLRTHLMDVWGGDVYTMSPGYFSSALPKTTAGFGRYSAVVADDALPSDVTVIDSGDDCAWVTDSDYSVSGTAYHESQYKEGSHYHGYSGATTAFLVYSTKIIQQYIWLTDGKMPQEIMMEYYLDSTWKRVYWGGGFADEDLITVSGHTPSLTTRIGDVPQATGKWLQLTIKLSDLGKITDTRIYGIVFGLYGGTARWDFTSSVNSGVCVYGLSPIQTVELYLDNGQEYSGTSSTPPINLDLCSGRVVFPTSGYFKISEGTELVYQSPWIPEIWNLDDYVYSAQQWYVNDVKTNGHVKGWIHDRQVGSLQYQDAGRTVAQESHTRYNWDGDPIEMKSRLDSGWIYSRAEYDEYGNQIMSTDPTGRGISTVYSVDDMYTYPTEIARQGSIADDFERDTSWTKSVSGAGGYTYWMDAKYATDESHSLPTSMQVNFSCSLFSYDTGTTLMWKEYSVSKIFDVSLWMYVETYSHDCASYETMDSGLKIRLYDSAGSNYATYAYWLACWSGSIDNKTTSDPNVKTIWGKPTMNTWLNPELSPQIDWPTADWGRCTKVRLELYAYASGAQGDSLKIYFDDISTHGKMTRLTYDGNTGNLLSSTDALGRVTSYLYEDLGRVTRITNPDGTYRTTTYDDVNRMITLLDELGHKTITYSDKLGRMIKTERYGSASSVYSSQTYTYDWQDKTATTTDEGGHVTSMSYDFFGRPTRVTNPDSTYMITSYDDVNRLVTAQSYTSAGALTHKMAMVSDDLGRLIASREYQSSAAYYETVMTYDAVDNLNTMDDSRSSYAQITTMKYDSLNRLTQTTFPDGYSEYATYDTAGRILTKTDREGNLTSISYDTIGNCVRVASPSDTLMYEYDDAGQNVKAKNNLGTLTYSYNNRGWVTSMSQIIGTSSYSVSFGYDAVGTRTLVTYPNGIQVTYAPDSYDRITSVAVSSINRLTIEYNTDDSVSKETTSDGEATSYTYNNRDWTTKAEMVKSSKVQYSLAYTYDDIGNVKTRGSESFVYDWLNRLTSASGGSLPSGLTYTYDEVGNIISKGGVARTYGIYNKITSDGTFSYSYDPNGNIVWKTSSTQKWNYQYNSLDEITKIVKWTYDAKKNVWSSATVGEFWYDANGARAKATEGAATTEYLYLDHELLCEKTGTTYTDYVYVNGKVKLKLVDTSTYFYFLDALGSTQQVWKLGATKAEYKVTTYEPFGKPVGVTGTDRITFAGEILDAYAGPSPGIYYIGARWYDPELGRWLSLDSRPGTSFMPQTLNRYVYCVNNPLTYVDPTGNSIVLYSVLVVGVCAGAGQIAGLASFIWDAYVTKTAEPTWGTLFRYCVSYELSGAAVGMELAGIGLVAMYCPPAAAMITQPSLNPILNTAETVQEETYEVLEPAADTIDEGFVPLVEYCAGGEILDDAWRDLTCTKRDAYENLIRLSDLYNLWGDGPVLEFDEWPSGVPTGAGLRTPQKFPI